MGYFDKSNSIFDKWSLQPIIFFKIHHYNILYYKSTIRELEVSFIFMQFSVYILCNYQNFVHVTSRLWLY